MGIFDRFSRLVRAEINHQTGRVSGSIPFERPPVDGGSRDSSAGASPSRETDVPSDVERALETLGLGPHADRQEARSAYLEALKSHHPDRHQDDGPNEARATEATARLNEAWDRLERFYER